MAQMINFFQPGTEAAGDYGQIQRQREIAAALLKQGQASPQGQMVGGRYVAPSPMAYVAQLANALIGGHKQRSADDQEKELFQGMATRRTKEANEFMGALSGGTKTIQPLTPNDDEGNPMPSTSTQVAPDRSKALAIALQSQNPTLQGMGTEMMKRQMDTEELQSILSGAGIGGGQAPAGGAPGGAPAGLPGGINPQAMALTLSRLPQAQKLGGMIQDASKPIPVTEGGTLFNQGTGQPMFTAPKTEPGISVQGGQAAPIPGFAAAQASRAGQIAAAEAAARDPYAAPVTVPTASGPRMMTPAQVRAEATGGGPVNGQPIPRPMAPREGDTDRAQIFAQELQSAQQRFTQAATPDDRRRAEADIAGIQKEIQSNRIQLPQGAGGGRGGQGGAGIPLMSEEQSAYGKERAKGFADMASTVQKTGQSGASMLRDLDELRTLYSDPNVAKGALAENISGLKNIGASFGVDMKGLSSEQAAQAITNKMALAARSTADGGGMPGAMSDADRNFLKNLQPDLSKSPEGRVKIMEAMQKVAQRQLDVARLATEYEQRTGRIDAGFDQAVRDYAAKNRMFTEAKKGGGFKILKVE